MKSTLQLLWKDQHVADIEDATWSDFPWVIGTLVPVNLTPELRHALEWLANIAKADELEDPPAEIQPLLDNWSVLSPQGEKTEAIWPLVDFDAGTVEWR